MSKFQCVKGKTILSLILVFSALNWGLVGFFGTDLIKLLFGENIFSSMLYIFIALAGAVYFLTHFRETARKESHSHGFLESMMPHALVTPHVPDHYNLELPIYIPDGTNAKYVVYWAADSSNNTRILPAALAYNQFENSGIAEVFDNKSIIRIAYPQAYHLPDGQIMSPHVHYRIMSYDGQLSDVKSVPISSKHELKPRRYTYSDSYSYL